MGRAILLILVLSCAAIGVGVYLLISESHRAFPELPAGIYAGTLTFEGSKKVTPFLIDRSDVGKDPAVFLADPLFPAQRAPLIEGGGVRLPLIVSGSNTRLRLVGAKINEKEFEGSFLNPITSEQGKWAMSAVRVSELSQNLASDLRAWASLWREFQGVEGKIESTERVVDSQKAKIEKLNRYLVDEDSLKRKASSRLGATTGALEEKRAKLAAVRAELDATTRKVEMAQRVSPKGRLALLARESLQRESRWIELSLKLLAPETAVGFEQSLERATKVKAIQDEIASERRRIAQLQDSGRYHGESAETASEEEFYRGSH